LVKAGIIKNFVAAVDHRALGRGLDALVDVRLLPTTKPEEFERIVAQSPAVLGVSFLTGRFDYQVHAACADPDDLDHTVRGLRNAGAGVTETRIVLRSQTYPPELR
jgi:Lrp/AsnC family transcriptional regulator, leucine-responsive regulatory protein